ncbi:MAG: hypothetical protein V4613_04120 [Bacteroidota bacterium]
MKPLFIIALVTLTVACKPSVKTDSGDSDSTYHQSVHALQSDMPEDTALYLPVTNTEDVKDSIEKVVLKALKLKSVKQIATLDGKELHDIYPLFQTSLKSIGDHPNLGAVEVYQAIFEKMDQQVLKLKDSQQLDIKDELEIAKLKSDIFTIFKQYGK